jgi:hypothetical protein
MKTMKVKLPNGKTATLKAKREEPVELTAQVVGVETFNASVNDAVNNAVNYAVREAISEFSQEFNRRLQELQASMPKTTDTSTLEGSVANVQQDVKELQQVLKSLSERSTEAPEMPTDKIQSIVQKAIQGIKMPAQVVPMPQKKTDYTFNVVRDKDGFIDSVKATPS